jgi:hypothetical protein
MREMHTRQGEQGAENSQKGCFLFEIGCFPILRKSQNRQSPWEVMGASQNRKEKHEKGTKNASKLHASSRPHEVSNGMDHNAVRQLKQNEI